MRFQNEDKMMIKWGFFFFAFSDTWPAENLITVAMVKLTAEPKSGVKIYAGLLDPLLISPWIFAWGWSRSCVAPLRVLWQHHPICSLWSFLLHIYEECGVGWLWLVGPAVHPCKSRSWGDGWSSITCLELCGRLRRNATRLRHCDMNVW